MASSEVSGKIREAFEFWVKEVQNPHFLFADNDPVTKLGRYLHPWTNGAWEAWKQLYVIGKS